MIVPKVLVFSGYGLNCEEETLFAFEHVGATGDIVHINDLIDGTYKLDEYQIMAIPGGFSYGDDTGSGNAFANRVRNNLWESVLDFVAKDTLVIGICNGCQALANLGLVPALEGKWGERNIALEHNSTARYQCRWVDLKVSSEKSIWLRDIKTLHIPVAHGEGKFSMGEDALAKLKEKDMVAAHYIKPSGELADGEFPYNPNGSLEDIAAVCDDTGRVLAMMPHPERGMFFTQREDWPLLKEQYKREGKELPQEADGMQVFRNAVEYFK